MARYSRRQFLAGCGAGPTLTKLAMGAPAAPASHPAPLEKQPDEKFTPVSLADYFNVSSRQFGPKARAKGLGGASRQDGLIRVLGGKRRLQGIPFLLGDQDVEQKSWVALSLKEHPWSSQGIEIPLGRNAHYICLASFCDWDENETPPPGKDVFEKVGQHLGKVVLTYQDGARHDLLIRRRYETSSPSEPWGHDCYAALKPEKFHPTKITDPLPHGTWWGALQIGVGGDASGGHGLGWVWVCALSTPEPAKTIETIRLEPLADDPWIVCGLSLFHRPEYPLRREKLSLFRITLPKPTSEPQNRWQLDLDLGVIARTFVPPAFQPESELWIPAARRGGH